ncbi:DUF3558 domain-containing protein [Actinomycetes bacterium KLBMP 9759]
MRILIAAALAGLILSACTTTSTVPPPAERPTATRPRDVPVSSLDPCDALTAAQLDALGVGDPEPSSLPTDPGRRICQWRRSPQEPVEGYLIEHILDFQPERLARNPLGAHDIVVSGFPAIETKSIGASHDQTCQIFVGTAPGQGIQIAYTYNGRSVPMTRELACQKARTAAEFAMETLIRQAGG